MIRRLALIGATATAVVAWAAAPAHAADELGLSPDGVTWTSELSAPLFDPGFVFVPGDVEERSFRLRNDGPSDGVLTVDVVAEDPDLLLTDTDVTLEARIGSGAWVPVATGTTRAVTELEVPQGSQTTVTLRAAFVWESTRMDERVPFHVDLTLSEDGDIAGEGDGDGDGDGNGNGVDGDGDGQGDVDGLPDTGNQVPRGVLWLSAGLIGTGLALVRPERRRREVNHHG